MSFLLPTALANRLSAGTSSSADATEKDSSKSSAKGVKDKAEPDYQSATLSWLSIYRILSSDERAAKEAIANEKGGDETAKEEDAEDNGGGEEKSDLDILFYTGRESAATHERIRRQIGVLRGAADFCASLIPGEEIEERTEADTIQRSAYTVHSQRERNIVLRLDEELWLATSVEVPRWIKSKMPKVRWVYDEEWRPDSWLISSLRSAWDTWSMLHGSAAKFLSDEQEGRRKLERSLERYFSVWATRWDVAGRSSSGLHSRRASHRADWNHTSLTDYLIVEGATDSAQQAHLSKFEDDVREWLGKPIRFTKASITSSQTTVETPFDACLFRRDRFVWHTHSAKAISASKTRLQHLIDHIRATYEPIITAELDKLAESSKIDRLRQEEGKLSSTVGGATSTKSTMQRLSWLPGWGSSAARNEDAKGPDSAQDPAKQGATEDLAPSQSTTSDKADAPVRSFPSISVTSSAWFGSAIPGLGASQPTNDKDTKEEPQPGASATSDAAAANQEEDSQDAVDEEVPAQFEEFSMAGWEADGTVVKARFLVRADLVALLLFKGEDRNPSDEDAQEIDIRQALWTGLKPVITKSLMSGSGPQLRMECSSIPHARTLKSTSAAPSAASSTVMDAAERILTKHEEVMRQGEEHMAFSAANGGKDTSDTGAFITEVMSRSNEGHAWVRTWQGSGSQWTHAIVPNARLSMAEAEKQTSQRAPPI